MTPDAAGPVEAALAEHWPDWGGEAVVCKCGWSVTYTRPRDTRDLWGMYFAHVAAALLPLFTAHGAAERRAGAVEALNEAADDFELVEATQGTFWKVQVVNLLRARAAALGDRADEAVES